MMINELFSTFKKYLLKSNLSGFIFIFSLELLKLEIVYQDFCLFTLNQKLFVHNAPLPLSL
jgi:hypothetical protein